MWAFIENTLTEVWEGFIALFVMSRISEEHCEFIWSVVSGIPRMFPVDSTITITLWYAYNGNIHQNIYNPKNQ